MIWQSENLDCFIAEPSSSMVENSISDPVYSQGGLPLMWDEAVKICGADSDFHRRDLWDAIESGEYPEWELGLQIFTEAQAAEFSFDVLDATKLIPEELVPIRAVGRMVLDHNPGNFFAETEQVAFCTAHVIPGIDFSNDPLLAGRIHSYMDTQISRLGGANFHELPINAPLAAVNNNQRDGMYRQSNARGRVAYEPNSLAGGCPFQAGSSGFVSFPENMEGSKLRGKSKKFLDHYTQASLFYESQTAVEKAHIIAGFRFELSKLGVPAIRERMLASLMNVSLEMSTKIASGLGMELPMAMARVLQETAKPEVLKSPSLSLRACPGDGSVKTRKVALLVANGVHGASITSVEKAIRTAGAVVSIVAPELGPIQTADGTLLTATATLENSPAVLFDALVLPDGIDCIAVLSKNALAREFVVNQIRHGKTILVIGESASLLGSESNPTPGIFLAKLDDLDNSTAAFLSGLGKHRHPEREALT